MAELSILPGISLAGLALWMPKEKTLAIADVHLGYEEALNREGIMLTREQFRLTVERLEPLLSHLSPETVVINGDLKHEFGTISEQEWKDVLKLLDLIARHSARTILVSGNHDTVLGPLAGKRGLEVVPVFRAGSVLFAHGDSVPDDALLKGVKTLVIGHEHPALALREGGRLEHFKCWLAGCFGKRRLVVMPSFNPVTEGTDILSERLLSPLLQAGIGDFSVYVVDDHGEILPFGTVKGLR